MANFEEQNTQPYDWENEGVYIIQNEDYVEGGQDGVSNRQAKELTKRTRNLHKRMSTAEGEIDTLQADVPVKVEAALRTAKDYTDAKDSVVRRDMATADTATLRSAKDYADTIVAALVDNSPEALNTLQELAVAMGNDPNFATTVMQQIGERAKTSDVNAALSGKANTSHSHDYLPLSGGTVYGSVVLDYGDMLGGRWIKQRIAGYDTVGLFFNRSIAAGIWSQLDVYTRGSDGFGKRLEIGEGLLRFQGKDVYHTGNLTPATTAATGLMSAADKTKLDNMREGLLASYQIAAGGNIQQYSGPKVSTKTVDKSGDGHYIVYHNIGHTSYFINVVAYGNRDAVCHAMVISKGYNQVEIAITNMDGGFVNCGFDLVLTI